MKKYLFVISFIILLSVNLFSLTLDQMLTEIRIQIGDNKSDTNNQHYSSSTLTTRINIVQDFIAKETLCLQVRISTPAIAEQQEYTFNSDVITPFRMAYYINGSDPPAYQRLEWYSVAALDKDTPTWQKLSSDNPTRIYTRGQTYGLVVKPSSIYVSTYSVQIDYYKRPDALTVGTSVPFDGDVLLYSYHDLIVKGVIIMCLEKGRDVSTLKQEYYALIQKMKDEVRTSQDGGIWQQ